MEDTWGETHPERSSNCSMLATSFPAFPVQGGSCDADPVLPAATLDGMRNLRLEATPSPKQATHGDEQWEVSTTGRPSRRTMTRPAAIQSPPWKEPGNVASAVTPGTGSTGTEANNPPDLGKAGSSACRTGKKALDNARRKARRLAAEMRNTAKRARMEDRDEPGEDQMETWEDENRGGATPDQPTSGQHYWAFPNVLVSPGNTEGGLPTAPATTGAQHQAYPGSGMTGGSWGPGVQLMMQQMMSGMMAMWQQQRTTCQLCDQPGHTGKFCPNVACSRCHQRGHVTAQCTRPRCTHCGKRDHRSSQCWHKSKPEAEKERMRNRNLKKEMGR